MTTGNTSAVRRLKEINKCLFEQVNANRAFKKDPKESLSNLGKIPQDIRQDPIQSYNILQEIYGILISSGNDPRVL